MHENTDLYRIIADEDTMNFKNLPLGLLMSIIIDLVIVGMLPGIGFRQVIKKKSYILLLCRLSCFR